MMTERQTHEDGGREKQKERVCAEAVVEFALGAPMQMMAPLQC